MRSVRLPICLLLLLIRTVAPAQATTQLRAKRVPGLQPPLTMTTSELSPAVLVQTTRPRLVLFGSMARWGLGAPAHLAFASRGGVRTLHRAFSHRLSVPGRDLREAWLLLGFRGAEGWSQWDSPWLVVPQYRPTEVILDDNGLQSIGRGAIGQVALMPLYGLYKPDTSRWTTLPAAVTARCRFWAGAVRKYPVTCEETFRIEPTTASVAVRSRFRWISTRDDWNTRPRRFAPLSPTLALAYRSGRMPMTVSAKVTDPDLCTAYGPYMGVPNTSQYEVRFSVLHYIIETEQPQQPDLSNPTVREAMRRLEHAMTQAFWRPDGLFHQDFGDPKGFSDPPPQNSDGGNTCWALTSAQYYCRSLPYLPVYLVAKAKPRLRRYFADWVLQPARYQPCRGKLLLVGPGIGTWGGYDDAGKFSANTILTLWTYAHNTGDIALMKKRWSLIQQLFVTPRECTWRGYGRDAIAEMGDEAAPALAMARLAHLVGDQETFGYAAFIFARELVHHVVKHTGASYFVAHQPIHTMERMPSDVYLTNLWGDTAGWQIDGPTWPRKTGERQYTNRWVRFGEPDVARFHRDHLYEYDRAELDGLLASGRFTAERKGTKDDPHILPSMVRLRSLLLNEPPDKLAAITQVDAPVHSDSGVAAYCMAFLRTSRPVRFRNLIPMTEAATAWAQGIARDRPEDEPVLTTTVQWRVGKEKRVGLPALTWWGWKPPKTDASIPGGDRWSFGQVLVDQPVTSGKSQRLSWNTAQVMVGF